MKNYLHSTLAIGRWGKVFKNALNQPLQKNKIRDNPRFSLALKAELNLIGKESLKFNALLKKMQPQCSYVGTLEKIPRLNSQEETASDMIQNYPRQFKICKIGERDKVAKGREARGREIEWETE